MKRLSMSLTSPYMAKRLEAPTLKRYLRDEVKNALLKAASGPTEDDTEEPNPKKRTYCAYCPSKKSVRLADVAKCAKKVICREHNIEMCLSCMKFISLDLILKKLTCLLVQTKSIIRN